MSTRVDSNGSRCVRFRGKSRSRCDVHRGATWVWVLAVILVVGMAGTAFAWRGYRRAARPGNDPNIYTVIRRDFSVVLKEKGELKAVVSTQLKSEVEGRSTILWIIDEGTKVEQGDLLVLLASDQIEDRIRDQELREAGAEMSLQTARVDLDIQKERNESDIRKAKLAIDLKKLALDKYMEGEWVQTLRDHEIAIEQAIITLERREEDWADAEKLFKQGFMTETKHEEARFNHKRATWDLEKAKRAKEVLEQYTHVAEKAQKLSDHTEAKKELERIKKGANAEEERKTGALATREREMMLIRDKLAKLRAQQEKCRITAPTPGFVVYGGGGGGRRHMMSSEDQIREGATVRERQVLVTLPDTSKMLVVVRIHEAKTDKIALGQRAIVTIEGLPGQRFTGTVTKIAAMADSADRWLNPDLKEYATEITLDETDGTLKPGVTAHAEILVQHIEDKLAIPIQTVFQKSGHSFVFRDQNGDVEPVEIKLGATGTEWVEVTEHLAVGDRILLAAGEGHERLLPDLPPIASKTVAPKAPPEGTRRGTAGTGRPGMGRQGMGRGKSGGSSMGRRGTGRPDSSGMQHGGESSRNRGDGAGERGSRRQRPGAPDSGGKPNHRPGRPGTGGESDDGK